MTDKIEKFVKVPFLGTEIQATADERHYVALKPLVEGIGLKWDGILRKVKHNKVLNSTMYVAYMVAEDGKIREMVCLPLDRINGLLFLINPEDYNHKPEVKERLLKYQEECYDVLHKYFFHGVVVSPKVAMASPEEQAESFRIALDNAVRHAMELAENWFAPKLERAEAERDKAIREKAWISSSREAKAMAEASRQYRKVRRLKTEFEDVRRELEVAKREFDEMFPDAEAHRRWRTAWDDGMRRWHDGMVDPDQTRLWDDDREIFSGEVR